MLSDEQYQALGKVAGKIGREFELALVLAHETGHRIGSIRLLRWSDADLERGVIRWRAENDKIGFEHVTLLSDEAKAALQSERQRKPSIGDAWLFPSAKKPTEACSRYVFVDGWRRATRLANLPQQERLGWHGLRRKFATELKDTPLKDLCYMGGWKEPTTVLTCYQQPDEATQRRALEQRKVVRIGASC